MAQLGSNPQFGSRRPAPALRPAIFKPGITRMGLVQKPIEKPIKTSGG